MTCLGAPLRALRVNRPRRTAASRGRHPTHQLTALLTSPARTHSFPSMSSRIHGADLETLLDDGIRYDRSGVSARARACFVQITERAHERPDIAAEAWWRLANVQRLQSQWDDAIASARAGADLARVHGLRDTEADALNIE